MPEIGEVARVVHFLRKHLLNRSIATSRAVEDDIIYGKVGTSATAFEKATQGRRVVDAAQQGKYFYVTFDRPPHAVMHLGMTGWIKFNVEDTAYYKQAKEKEGKKEDWPPRFWKFLWTFDAETIDGMGKEAVEVAFVDPRRLGRIRLVNCDADKIRDTTPLKENGPDPVRDKDILTVDWLKNLTRRKKVPIKALLLDQANISGVGNWVADEVLYQARLHPEQYCNTFNDEQIQDLHNALISVCTTAVELLADSSRFPENWIMKHRWNKGKKDSNMLPNGEKIVHLTVGGRTSAVVPSRQKKTAAVAGDVDADNAEEDVTPAKGRKRKARDGDAGDVEKTPASKKSGQGRKSETNGVVEEDGEMETKTIKARPKSTPKATPKKAETPQTSGSRRSTRSAGR